MGLLGRGEVGVGDGDWAAAAGGISGGGDRRRGKDGEEEGGDSNADEDENEALLAEHVANRANDGEPWLVRLGRILVIGRLGLVAPVDQLRRHCFGFFLFSLSVNLVMCV